MASVSASYLVSDLRMLIGDTTAGSYRFLDNWLETAIIASVKSLGRWWGYRYLIDDLNMIYRNTQFTGFLFTEPPVIQQPDERVILLMSAITVLSGDLENNAWNISSWKDAEISYSNIESGKVKNDFIKRLWDELMYLLTPPSKKLAGTRKGSLPGYLNNTYEKTTDF